MSSPTPFLNAALDVVIATTGDIAADLSTLRPLLRNAIFSAYATDKVENTPIASFPDGADNVPMKSATFAIQPVQDLHGYDSPWPAGGGKNLFETTATSKTEAGVTYTVNADGSVSVSGTATAYTSLELGTSPIDISLGTVTISGISDATNIAWGGITLLDDNNEVVHTITNGSSQATFTADLSQYPTATKIRLTVKRQNNAAVSGTLKPMVELGSTATAFAPYSNICPISGFTGAEVTGTGINWAKLSEDNKGSNQKSTVVYTEDGATVTATGTYGRMGWLIPVKEGETYTVSLKCSATNYGSSYLNRIFLGNKNAAWSSADDGYITFNVVNTTEGNWSYTFTATTSVLFIGVYITTTATSGSITISNLQVEVGSTATPYIPYVGTTHDITWSDEAGTVYGGTLEYLGGDAWRLTATNGIDIYDGTESWTAASISQGFYHQNDTIKRSLDYTGSILCDRLKTYPRNGSGSYAIASFGITGYGDASYPNQNWIYAKAEGATTVAEFKAWLTANPITVVYPLATPVVYDLTGEELATVLGNNNVFANCGAIEEITYRADVAKYIEKKLAEA